MSRQRLVRVWASNCDELTPGSFSCEMRDISLANVMAVSLKTLTFINSQTNIRDGVNTALAFVIDGDLTFVEVPAGQYTLNELLLDLSTRINANAFMIAAGATVAFSVSLGRVVATVTGGTTIQWNGANFVYDSSADIGPFIGLTEISPTLPTGGAGYTFPSLPALQGLTHVTFNLRTKNPFTKLNESPIKVRSTNSLGMVPVDVPFGFQQTYIQPDLGDSRLDYDSPQDLRSIEFKVRDERGLVLQGQKNSLTAEFMVYYN